jgi:hypothetical protein
MREQVSIVPCQGPRTSASQNLRGERSDRELALPGCPQSFGLARRPLGARSRRSSFGIILVAVRFTLGSGRVPVVISIALIVAAVVIVLVAHPIIADVLTEQLLHKTVTRY